ncbi:unnamed protein product, partial [Prorocentrum cordatum]
MQRDRYQEELGEELADRMAETDAEQRTLDELNAHVASAIQHAAEACLSTLPAARHRPWISSATLELITSRSDARKNGDYTREKQPPGTIKASAKTDRNKWLDDLPAPGDWAEVRKLREASQAKQGRTRAATGAPVDSDQRAGTLAEYCRT